MYYKNYESVMFITATEIHGTESMVLENLRNKLKSTILTFWCIFHCNWQKYDMDRSTGFIIQGCHVNLISEE